MPYNRKTLGIIISRRRMEKGMSQEVLSGLAGISRSHLAEIETGRQNVRLDTLWRISLALDMRPSEMIADMEKWIEEQEEET